MSPTRPATRCPSCKQLHRGIGRCEDCAKASDRSRGTSSQRGYDQQHRSTFRAYVLDRDPVCVVCKTAPSTVADHHPRSRRQLVAQGADPNDPRHGRGLCAGCHGRETASNPAQRGGWNRR